MKKAMLATQKAYKDQGTRILQFHFINNKRTASGSFKQIIQYTKQKPKKKKRPTPTYIAQGLIPLSSVTLLIRHTLWVI